ncbi:MAG: Eco57I restriction-modification methylase domain-containing protein [Smithella sp.]
MELHNAWQKTLDTKELNKHFYEELSRWYFWAIHEVTFPGAAMEADKSGIFQLEDKVREHNAKNLIRLLTRILFIWFIKEKNLIPDELFDEAYIRDNLINGFEPRKKSNFDHKTQGSKYYRAILQNLFFATLNQTVGKRQFRKEGQQMNVTNLLRYENYFQNPEAFVKMVEEVVPFMNGGLFECLDSPDPVLKGKKGGDVIIYEDGFSDRKDNILCVPDYIFFVTDIHTDLSSELEDKRQKDVTVSGLFNILKSYKFTVTENTPIEEEVALDPELLGRVFENLLASYNPETKTTARKQTGSFYTPREIVNYMVDESLKAYLQQKLETEADMKPEDAEVGLEFLIGYNEKKHLFDEKQTAVLIDAIDNCKILDPACGSGAFPMGVLHKLVHVLHKLDLDNEKWRGLQRQKAIKETEEAFRIGNRQEREGRLKEISDIFENNSDDYGRKLYLIENCIYGVDIQPIATQISKLRFFISLIVDQKSNKDKAANYGIRPLPNLETKFVAANTLIGIEKPQVGSIAGSLFDNKEVKILEEKIRDVRHRLFSAKTPSTKRKLREEDQKFREEMGKILEDTGWSNESARQLAGWDPYNQNASSPFFDTEWMFGLLEGFDVVIGNPPYVDSETMTKNNLELRNLLKDQYDTAKGNWDLFVIFIEKGMKLTRVKGALSYIVPNKLISAKYTSDLRSYLNTKSIHKLIDYSMVDVFKEADVYPIVFLATNSKHSNSVVSTKVMKDLSEPMSFNTINSNVFYQDIFWDKYFFDKNIVDLIIRITLNKKLNTLFPHIYGAATVNEAYQIKEIIKDQANYINNQTYFKFINTGTIDPYKSLWGIKNTQYIKGSYGKPIIKEADLKRINPVRLKQSSSPKIIIAGMSLRIEAFFDKGEYCAGKSTTIIIDNANRLKTLTGILNSKIVSFWQNKYFNSLSMAGGYFNIGPNEISLIPIPNNLVLPLPQISNAVDYLMFQRKIDRNSGFFEFLIDAMVYEIYFPEEIKAADAEVLKHLTNNSTTLSAGLPELKDEWPDEKKLKVVEKVHKELSDPRHPVSIAMARQKTVPEMRIIEGLDK